MHAIIFSLLIQSAKLLHTVYFSEYFQQSSKFSISVATEGSPEFYNAHPLLLMTQLFPFSMNKTASEKIIIYTHDLMVNQMSQDRKKSGATKNENRYIKSRMYER